MVADVDRRPRRHRAEALAALRELVGRDDADFHDRQYEAIEALVDGRRRALVVQRTGWGKSAVYFVATLLLRRRGGGPTVLVSPLLALMRDQIAAAERAGVRAVAINSTNPHEWADVQQRLADDAVDVLLVSPSASTTRRSASSSCPRSCAGSACSSSTRPIASATGATTSAPTTGGCATSSPGSRPACPCSRPRRPPTAGWWPMSPSSSGTATTS